MIDSTINNIKSISFSPIENYLAAINGGRTITVWDLNKKAVVKKLNSQKSILPFIDYTKDGQNLVSYGDSVIIWNVNNWSIAKTFRIDVYESYNPFAISSDGTKIAVSGKTINLYNLFSGEKTIIIKGHVEKIGDIRFSYDGKDVVTKSLSYAKAWDITNKKPIELFENIPGEGTFLYSPKGKYIASNIKDTVKIRDCSTGRIITSLDGIFSLWFCFSPNENELAVIDYWDPKMRIFEVLTGKLKKTLTNIGYTIEYSADEKNILSVGTTTHYFPPQYDIVFSEVILRALNIEKDSLIYSNSFYHRYVVNTEFSYDGKMIGILDKFGGVIVRNFFENETLLDIGYNIRNFCFSSDGQYIALAVADSIKILRIKDKSQVKSIKYENGYPTALCFSFDGNKIASGGVGLDNIRIYDISEGNLVKDPIQANGYFLYQNYPNPFNSATIIKFAIPFSTRKVNLTIYDLLGRQVEVLINDYLNAGKYSFRLEEKLTRKLSSGIYFYKLSCNNFNSIKKFILLK